MKHPKDHSFVVIPREQKSFSTISSTDSHPSQSINVEYMPLLSYSTKPYLVLDSSVEEMKEESSYPPSIDISVEYLWCVCLNERRDYGIGVAHNCVSYEGYLMDLEC